MLVGNLAGNQEELFVIRKADWYSLLSDYCGHLPIKLNEKYCSIKENVVLLLVKYWSILSNPVPIVFDGLYKQK